MINSLSRYLAIPAIILLASCKGDGKKDVVMTANQSGNITRAHWQAERKPIVIETDTLLTECIGVSMLLRDATADVSALVGFHHNILLAVTFAGGKQDERGKDKVS